jgi:nicotinate-nucleotide adenylyltransferase
MKIAILGGAFNPPHLGHLLIARQVLDFTDTEELWFLPNFGQKYLGGNNPAKITASYVDRLAMAQMITLPQTRVSAVEIDHQLDGQTINLIPHLPKENIYSFVIGSDWLPSFHLWNGYQELLKFMSFIVFPRLGYSSEPLYPNMTVLHHEHLVLSNISSTKVRARVAAGLSIAEFVPGGVEEYIRAHALYK